MKTVTQKLKKLQASLPQNKKIKLVVVTKTRTPKEVQEAIAAGAVSIGENKVQEAIEKWSDVKLTNNDIRLHLIGGLQTNKVKLAVKLFDYIHSVDSEKLAKKISIEQQKQKKKVRVFIQVNIGNEGQKFGVDKLLVPELCSYCKTLDLEVVGLMCIPPLNKPSEVFFKEMSEMNKKLNFEDLRAIPFVGSWSQSKQNIPGFYGVGTALNYFKKNNDFQLVKSLYNNSLFFRTLIANSMMSLSKSFFGLTNYIADDDQYGDCLLYTSDAADE